MKKMMAVMVVAVLLGLWLGINLGREQPLFSNPFVEKTAADKLLDATAEMFEDSRRALKRSLED